MNTRRLLLVCFVTLFELSATSHLAKANQSKTTRTPFAVREQWASDWKTGNVQGLRTLYAKDAIFLPAAGRLLDGPSDIGNYLEHVIDTSESRMMLEPNVGSEASGDLAYDYGAIQYYSKTDKAVVKGFYLMVLKRDSQKQWHIMRQALTEIGCYTHTQP
jgi:ketosteroid isomerase-like protein